MIGWWSVGAEGWDDSRHVGRGAERCGDRLVDVGSGLLGFLVD